MLYLSNLILSSQRPSCHLKRGQAWFNNAGCHALSRHDYH